MGYRLLWGVQAMLLGSLKQGCRLLWGNRIGVAAEPVPFPFGGTGVQTLTKQVEL